MEWNGVEWNGMEWNGMEWNGIFIYLPPQSLHRREYLEELFQETTATDCSLLLAYTDTYSLDSRGCLLYTSPSPRDRG
eukprot:194938-Amphidinium_carterae.1